jgi:hypothetical protein
LRVGLLGRVSSCATDSVHISEGVGGVVGTHGAWGTGGVWRAGPGVGSADYWGGKGVDWGTVGCAKGAVAAMGTVEVGVGPGGGGFAIAQVWCWRLVGEHGSTFLVRVDGAEFHVVFVFVGGDFAGCGGVPGGHGWESVFVDFRALAAGVELGVLRCSIVEAGVVDWWCWGWLVALVCCWSIAWWAIAGWSICVFRRLFASTATWRWTACVAAGKASTATFKPAA